MRLEAGGRRKVDARGQLTPNIRFRHQKFAGETVRLGLLSLVRDRVKQHVRYLMGQRESFSVGRVRGVGDEDWSFTRDPLADRADFWGFEVSPDDNATGLLDQAADVSDRSDGNVPHGADSTRRLRRAAEVIKVEGLEVVLGDDVQISAESGDLHSDEIERRLNLPELVLRERFLLPVVEAAAAEPAHFVDPFKDVFRKRQCLREVDQPFVGQDGEGDYLAEIRAVSRGCACGGVRPQARSTRKSGPTPEVSETGLHHS